MPVPDTTGFMARPVFQQPPPRWKAPERPSRWAEHIALGRLHPAWPEARKPPAGWVEPNPPRGWMLVSRVTKGGREATNRAIHNDATQIRNWLVRHAPLERWEIRVRTVPDTWCDRELYLRYLGTLTQAEHKADVAERKAAYAAKQAKIAERKAKRALEARLAARAAQDANRDSGRRRG